MSHCAHSMSTNTYRLNGNICSSSWGLHTRRSEGVLNRKVEAVFGLAELIPKFSWSYEIVTSLRVHDNWQPSPTRLECSNGQFTKASVRWGTLTPVPEAWSHHDPGNRSICGMSCLGEYQRFANFQLHRLAPLRFMARRQRHYALPTVS